MQKYNVPISCINSKRQLENYSSHPLHCFCLNCHLWLTHCIDVSSSTSKDNLKIWDEKKHWGSEAHQYHTYILWASLLEFIQDHMQKGAGNQRMPSIPAMEEVNMECKGGTTRVFSFCTETMMSSSNHRGSNVREIYWQMKPCEINVHLPANLVLFWSASELSYSDHGQNNTSIKSSDINQLFSQFLTCISNWIIVKIKNANAPQGKEKHIIKNALCFTPKTRLLELLIIILKDCLESRVPKTQKVENCRMM